MLVQHTSSYFPTSCCLSFSFTSLLSSSHVLLSSKEVAAMHLKAIIKKMVGRRGVFQVYSHCCHRCLCCRQVWLMHMLSCLTPSVCFSPHLLATLLLGVNELLMAACSGWSWGNHSLGMRGRSQWAQPGLSYHFCNFSPLHTDASQPGESTHKKQCFVCGETHQSTKKPEKKKHLCLKSSWNLHLPSPRQW